MGLLKGYGSDRSAFFSFRNHQRLAVRHSIHQKYFTRAPSKRFKYILEHLAPTFFCDHQMFCLIFTSNFRVKKIKSLFGTSQNCVRTFDVIKYELQKNNTLHVQF